MWSRASYKLYFDKHDQKHKGNHMKIQMQIDLIELVLFSSFLNVQMCSGLVPVT